MNPDTQDTTLDCKTPLGRISPSVGRMLRERRRRFGGRPAYRERKGSGPYETLTYAELYRRTVLAGASLSRLGLRKGDVVATLSRNRSEMLILELAVMSAGGVACPIFSEYPAPQLDYVLEHSGARMLAVSDGAHLQEAMKTEAARRLDRIFVMDWDPSLAAAGFADLLAPGPGREDFERALESVAPGDPCLLMYTSGTTGQPKGVLLCHRNILSQRKAISLLWDLGPEDRFLSYLPWHHSFGGIFELFGALYHGAALTLDESYGKDAALLIENFKRVKPTVYFSVPRVYQAIVAEARKSRAVEREIIHPDLKFVFTAAAPLPPPIADYFAAKGIPVVEGWGLTETAPCVTLTPLDGTRSPGVVGRPLPGIRLRVAEDGEILVHGPNVMLGYYKDPERTSRVIDPLGWFHTGDFGSLRPQGLFLRGRMDGMFKLSSGMIVVSQEVEAALCASPAVRHAVVFGTGEDFVGAIVWPEPGRLERLARQGGGDPSPGSREASLRDALRREEERAARAVPAKYQRPRAFVIASEEPSLANGQLTPSMKLVKNRILEDYADAIRAMFKPLEAEPALREEVVRLA